MGLQRSDEKLQIGLSKQSSAYNYDEIFINTSTKKHSLQASQSTTGLCVNIVGTIRYIVLT